MGDDGIGDYLDKLNSDRTNELQRKRYHENTQLLTQYTMKTDHY